LTLETREEYDIYSLDVELDDVRFQLQLWDMTGKRKEYLMSQQPHAVVVAYAIDNLCSLREVTERVGGTL